MVVDATLANGLELRYQLFIGARPAHPWPEFLEGKERELLAVVPDGEGGEVVFYDALVDPDLAIAVLHLVVPDIEVEVRRPIVLEHSNSSVVFDEAHILKVLRKVEAGPNPDVEIPRVLAERGFEHVLPPRAELRRDDMDLAVLRDFLVGATEGWQLARASVRDVLASRLPPEESGGDLAPDSGRLGTHHRRPPRGDGGRLGRASPAIPPSGSTRCSPTSRRSPATAAPPCSTSTRCAPASRRRGTSRTPAPRSACTATSTSPR